MAEQEVIKHAKKVYNTVTNKETSFWHKLKEFILEILIIVFAVTLSIWVHDRSEYRHQQKDVKEFLFGLRDDLTRDSAEMRDDMKAFYRNRAAYAYVNSLKMSDKADRDSLRKHYSAFFNTTGLVPNNGRFEGFKASGKIGFIEDEQLQNLIMDLYQENIPSLVLSTDYYTTTKLKLVDYFNQAVVRTTDSTTNTALVIKSDVTHNLSGMLVDVSEILIRYNACLDKISQIKALIAKEYD